MKRRITVDMLIEDCRLVQVFPRSPSSTLFERPIGVERLVHFLYKNTRRSYLLLFFPYLIAQSNGIPSEHGKFHVHKFSPDSIIRTLINQHWNRIIFTD